MPAAHPTVATTRPSRYLTRLCRHVDQLSRRTAPGPHLRPGDPEHVPPATDAHVAWSDTAGVIASSTTGDVHGRRPRRRRHRGRRNYRPATDGRDEVASAGSGSVDVRTAGSRRRWRSCIIGLMAGRSGVTARYDAFRLVVLALTLVGFVAMHGLASAGSGSAHCAVPDILLSSAGEAGHDMAGHDMAGGRAATTADAHAGPAADSTAASPTNTGDDGGTSVAGCLLALLGGLVALALRLVRSSSGHTPIRPASSALVRERPARAPPRPLFLSLCVIRL